MKNTPIFLLVIVSALLGGCWKGTINGELDISLQQLLFESNGTICSGDMEGFLTCASKARFEFANRSTHYIRLIDSTRGYTLGQDNLPQLKVKLKKGRKFHFTIPYTVQISEDGRELVFDFSDSGFIKIPISEIKENKVEMKFKFDAMSFPWPTIDAIGFASFKVSLPEELIRYNQSLEVTVLADARTAPQL